MKIVENRRKNPAPFAEALQAILELAQNPSIIKHLREVSLLSLFYFGQWLDSPPPFFFSFRFERSRTDWSRDTGIVDNSSFKNKGR